jgi:hypothetical protein
VAREVTRRAAMDGNTKKTSFGLPFVLAWVAGFAGVTSAVIARLVVNGCFQSLSRVRGSEHKTPQLRVNTLRPEFE